MPAQGLFRRVVHLSVTRPWTAFFTTLILLVLLTRIAWGWHANHLWEREKLSLRRAGRPVAVEEITYPFLADEENAATWINRAAANLNPRVYYSANAMFQPFNDYPPFPPSWWKEADASEQANAKAFALARSARRCATAQWRKAFPETERLAAPLGGISFLIDRLVTGALRAHLTGDDAEALERCRDLLHIGRALHADVIHYKYIAISGADAAAIKSIMVIAPGLHFSDAGSSTRPGSVSASRQQLRDVINELLDDRALWGGLSVAFRLERLTCMIYVATESRLTWLIRPLAAVQLRRTSRGLSVLEESARRPNAPRIDAHLRASGLFEDGLDMQPSILAQLPKVSRYSRWYNSWSPWSTERLITSALGTLADRRAAAVSLAAQLYRADTGRYPARLDDLVPNYLPAIPEDPFLDGKPLGYLLMPHGLPDGAPRPLVRFHAGEQDVIPDEPVYSTHDGYGRNSARWTGRWTGRYVQYRDLARWTPTSKPAFESGPAVKP